MAGWKAAELEWGRGARVFEVFLEPTCPYSNKAFGKIKEVLSTVGEDKVTVKVRLQSQPWHLYSGVIVRAILAASTLDNGREAAWRVMEAVAAHREEFEFDKHCTGPTAQLLQTILSRGSSVIAASNWPLHSTFQIWTGRSNCIADTQGKMESMSARHS